MGTIIETIKFAELGAMPKQLQLFDAMLTNQGETLLAICASVKRSKTLLISFLFLYHTRSFKT
jgi:hypothetical protein